MEIVNLVSILDEHFHRESVHLKQTEHTNDYSTSFIAGNNTSFTFLVNNETEIEDITRCCLNHHDNHCYVYIVKHNFNNVIKLDIAEITSLVIS